MGINKLPAHDFVSKQDAAHFGILILAFINDGLKEGKKLITAIAFHQLTRNTRKRR